MPAGKMSLNGGEGESIRTKSLLEQSMEEALITEADDTFLLDLDFSEAQGQGGGHAGGHSRGHGHFHPFSVAEDVAASSASPASHYNGYGGGHHHLPNHQGHGHTEGQGHEGLGQGQRSNLNMPDLVPVINPYHSIPHQHHDVTSHQPQTDLDSEVSYPGHDRQEARERSPLRNSVDQRDAYDDPYERGREYSPVRHSSQHSPLDLKDDLEKIEKKVKRNNNNKADEVDGEDDEDGDDDQTESPTGGKTLEELKNQKYGEHHQSQTVTRFVFLICRIFFLF